MSLLMVLALLAFSVAIALAIPSDIVDDGELEAEDWAELDEHP